MSSIPHIAGSPEGKKQGEWVAGKFKEFGFDRVEIKKYKVLLSYPTEPGAVKVMDDKGDEDFTFKSVEKAYNKYENDSRALPPFIAYSQSGTFEVSSKFRLVFDSETNMTYSWGWVPLYKSAQTRTYIQ